MCRRNAVDEAGLENSLSCLAIKKAQVSVAGSAVPFFNACPIGLFIV